MSDVYASIRFFAHWTAYSYIHCTSVSGKGSENGYRRPARDPPAVTEHLRDIMCDF